MRVKSKSRTNAVRERMPVSPNTILTTAQVRDGIVDTIWKSRGFLFDFEADEFAIEEKICWLLLLLAQINGEEYAPAMEKTAEMWAQLLGSTIKADLCYEMLIDSIDTATKHALAQTA